MRVATQLITTPADDGLTFDLDWRDRVAQAVCTTSDGTERRLPRTLAKDKPLKQYVAHLRSKAKTAALRQGQAMTVYDRISGWHTDDTIKGLVQALLLTGASYKELATEVLGGIEVKAQDLQMYQDVFFNIRDDHEGKVRVGVVVRICAQMNADRGGDRGGVAPDGMLLKRAAITGGLPLLKNVLGCERTDSAQSGDGDDERDRLEQLVNTELTKRVLASDMRTGDLSRLAAMRTAHEKMLHETGQKQKADNEAIQLLTQIMGLMAPHMIPQTKTEDEMAAETKAIQSKLLAEQNVRDQSIADNGANAGKEALDATIKKHFASPVA